MDGRIGDMDSGVAFPPVEKASADLDVSHTGETSDMQTLALEAEMVEREAESAFAEGLPEWDVLPPYSKIRRNMENDFSATHIFRVD